MERQFRYPTGKTLLEVPAGLVEAGEDPLEAAKRELLEETGCRSDDWTRLYRFYTSPGFTDEMITLFLAKNAVGDGHQSLDEGEELSFEAMPFEGAWRLAETGMVEDAKTLMALLWYKQSISA